MPFFIEGITMTDFRIEKDSMGEIEVPADALYGAQTQRAIDNFPISDMTLPREFIRALALIKGAAAQVNQELGLLPAEKAKAIQGAVDVVETGDTDDNFLVDVFQTGSGTSTNMNCNEVLSRLATQQSGVKIHPNDDVNMSQSSNDVIPTAIHVAAALMVEEQLLPALETLSETIKTKANSLKQYVKTGRTHLMDAMPVRFDQEMSGWYTQVDLCIQRIVSTLPRLHQLALGGTAVGTGINAHPQFGTQVAAKLAQITGLEFKTSPNYFESLSCQDTAVELSGQLRTLAVALMKICNDLRWMNSGPLAGLADIHLQDLQPGSSIMPGKVNPVIPEAVCMVCAQVMGNDTTIMVAGQSGNFQLNVMLPVIAYNLLQSIEILTNACDCLGESAISNFKVNEAHINNALDRNPILVTALNPIIGYEKGAAIAKEAYKSGRSVREVTKEMTDLTDAQITEYLNPAKLTEGGVA
jgi:fumarate hydratase class II